MLFFELPALRQRVAFTRQLCFAVDHPKIHLLVQAMSYRFDTIRQRLPPVLARDGPDLAAEEHFPERRLVVDVQIDQRVGAAAVQEAEQEQRLRFEVGAAFRPFWERSERRGPERVPGTGGNPRS